MPNLFEDEFTGRLDLSSEETAMYLYDVDPDESFPYPWGARTRSSCGEFVFVDQTTEQIALIQESSHKPRAPEPT